MSPIDKLAMYVTTLVFLFFSGIMYMLYLESNKTHQLKLECLKIESSFCKQLLK